MKHNFREYTPVPNKLIEEVIKLKLRGSSIKVLFVIINATIRWEDGEFRKHKFPIAYSRIMAETDYSKQTVSEALKELEEKEIIEVERVYKKTSVIGIHSRLFDNTGLISEEEYKEVKAEKFNSLLFDDELPGQLQ